MNEPQPQSASSPDRVTVELGKPFPMPRFLRSTLAITALAALLAASPVPARAATTSAVHWSAAQISASGLVITPLAPAAWRQSFSASAMVQNPAQLLHDLSALAVARAQVVAARSARQLAQLQAQRLEGLFQAGQNVALAAVQQAQSQVQEAQAQLDVAQATEQAAQATLRTGLGPALAARVEHDATLRQALADGRELMVDLTLPPGAGLPAAARVWLLRHGTEAAKPDAWLPAQLVGPAASASAQVQGLRYVLLAPAASGLMPGLHLQARVEAGRTETGVLLPASSVVWTHGQAVAFVASAAPGGGQRLAPRIVSTGWPLHGGYVQPGWGALAVVTRGAGLVLTPPPAPQAHIATGGDDD